MVQPQVAEWPFDLDRRPKLHGLKDSLEGGISQARRDHDHAFTGRARDGEATSIALGVGLGRVDSVMSTN